MDLKQMLLQRMMAGGQLPSMPMRMPSAQPITSGPTGSAGENAAINALRMALMAAGGGGGE